MSVPHLLTQGFADLARAVKAARTRAAPVLPTSRAWQWRILRSLSVKMLRHAVRFDYENAASANGRFAPTL